MAPAQTNVFCILLCPIALFGHFFVLLEFCYTNKILVSDCDCVCFLYFSLDLYVFFLHCLFYFLRICLSKRDEGGKRVEVGEWEDCGVSERNWRRRGRHDQNTLYKFFFSKNMTTFRKVIDRFYKVTETSRRAILSFHLRHNCCERLFLGGNM